MPPGMVRPFDRLRTGRLTTSGGLGLRLGQALSMCCGLHDILQISGYSSCLAGGEPERGHYYDEADGYAYSVDLHLTSL